MFVRVVYCHDISVICSWNIFVPYKILFGLCSFMIASLLMSRGGRKQADWDILAECSSSRLRKLILADSPSPANTPLTSLRIRPPLPLLPPPLLPNLDKTKRSAIWYSHISYHLPNRRASTNWKHFKVCRCDSDSIQKRGKKIQSTYFFCTRVRFHLYILNILSK